jgi:hypothetical protein
MSSACYLAEKHLPLPSIWAMVHSLGTSSSLYVEYYSSEGFGWLVIKLATKK